MKNTLIHPLEAVHFDQYQPEDIQEAVGHGIKLAKDRLKSIYALKESAVTFENTVLSLTRCDQELEFAVGIAMHLETMHTSKWTEAKDYALKRYSAFSLEIQFDQKLYSKLLAVKQNEKTLEPHKNRLLDKILKDYEDNGINLPKHTQARIKVLSKRATKLCSKFKPNILQAREKHPMHLLNVDLLKGVRKEQIASYADAAKAEGKKGYLIQTDDGNFDVIMTSCSVAATRRTFHKLYTASVTTKNHKLLYEILTIRHELAKILGYKTPGHMLMRNRMVQDPNDAIKFVEKLMSHYSEKARSEYKDLLAYIQSIEEKPIKSLEQFEFDSGLDLYYPAKYFEHLYNLNLEDTKEYFEFTSVRDYMLQTLSRLYSVRFEASTLPSWHKDVEVYDIYDAQDNHLAQVHCDWFSRKDKHGHAWMNEFIVADRSTGVTKPHIGCVIMNVTPATKNSPSLMSINSVETMWHEFGHFMHLTFSATKLKEQSMMHCKWDFVEAPSQIMENWVLHKDMLPNYAKHYKNGKVLTPEVVEIVKKMSLFNIGIKAMRQLYFSYVDLKIHSDIVFADYKEMAKYARAVREETLPVKTMPYFATLSTFGHIVGGYGSGYYTYKWSESIQADLFTRFEKEGVLNPEVGEAYKTKILARGDEADPDKLIYDFLGRQSTPEAMLKRDGVL